MGLFKSIGKFLNHTADVAGGLLGRITGTTAANAQQQANYENQIQTRVADGLKAGINPLAAIGASTNYQPYFQTNDSSGAFGMASMAGDAISGLSKGIKGLLGKKVEDDMSYDSEVKALDLESRRLENRILKQELSAMRGSISSDKPKSEVNDRPSREGDEALFKVAYDLQGRPRLVVNQNVMEGDSDNAGYVASLKHAISQGFVDKISGKVNSDQYKMMLDDMYYNMYGRHIANLDDLYFSPAEVTAATVNLARGI